MAEKSEDLKKKGISYDDSDDEGDSTCGLLLMKLNLVPRKKLIVLIYRRPYCKDFMDFCLERFEVGIWSSARETERQIDCYSLGPRQQFFRPNTNQAMSMITLENTHLDSPQYHHCILTGIIIPRLSAATARPTIS
ncbi:hypothetical protein CUMW_006570, partial [Citrus unshiu]